MSVLRLWWVRIRSGRRLPDGFNAKRDSIHTHDAHRCCRIKPMRTDCAPAHAMNEDVALAAIPVDDLAQAPDHALTAAHNLAAWGGESQTTDQTGQDPS